MKTCAVVGCLLLIAVSALACLDWKGGAGGGWAISGTAQGDLLVLGEGHSLIVADLSTPEFPVKMGAVHLLDDVNGVAVRGTLAYTAVNRAGLWVVDVSDRTTPRVMMNLPTPSKALGVRVEGPLLILTLESGAARFYDLSVPDLPLLEGGGIDKIKPFDADWPYIVTSVRQGDTPPIDALVVWDVSDCRNPREISRTPLGRMVSSIGVEWPHAYITTVSNDEDCMRLEVWSIGDPQLPSFSGATSGLILDILSVDGTYLFAKAGTAYPGSHSLQLWDVSNPLQARLLCDWQEFGKYTYRFFISFPFAIVAECNPNQFRILRVDPEQEPMDVAFPINGLYLDARAVESTIYALKAGSALAMEILDFRSPTDIRKVTEVPLYFNEYRVYCMGASVVYACGFDTVQAVDVSDPLHPIPTRIILIPNSYSEHVGVAVSGHHAFIAYHAWVAVLDISDPLYPRYLGRFTSAAGGEDYSGISAIAASGSRLIIGSNDWVDVLDIADPLHPVRLSSTVLGEGIAGLKARGDLLFVLAGGAALHVYDLHDPRQPAPIGWMNIPSFIMEDWVTAGDRLLISGRDGIYNEMVVVDIADPHRLRLLARRTVFPDSYILDRIGCHAMISGMTLDFFDLEGCTHGRPVGKP